LRIAYDSAPDAPKAKAMRLNQWQRDFGKQLVIFGYVMRAQLVRDFEQDHYDGNPF
jgi:hypothetical protein